MVKVARFPVAVAVALALAVLMLGTVVPATPADAGLRTYVVEAGDTVSGIAARFGITPAALVSANHIVNPDDILIGARLVIPTGDGGASDGGDAQGPAGTAARGPSVYVVRAGDTLGGIAGRFGVSVPALAAANDLTNPDLVVIGTRLVIPGTGSGGGSPGGGGVVQRGPLAPVYPPPYGRPSFPAPLRAYPSRLALRPVFVHWARVFGVPAGLLEALTWMESGWQSGVVSSTGAVGIGQLEPSTVRFVSLTLLGRATPLNPRVAPANIEMSAAFLAWMIRAAHGNLANALGGYYQGLVSLYASGPFPSTRTYVLVIGELWQQFRSG